MRQQNQDSDFSSFLQESLFGLKRFSFYRDGNVI